MKKRCATRRLKTKFAALAMGGILLHVTALPLGGCNFQDITATTTLDGRTVFLGLAQSAIVTPINDWVNHAVNDLFDELDDDE